MGLRPLVPRGDPERFLLLVSHGAGGVDQDSTAFSPLLPTSLWLLLVSLWRIFSARVQVILRDRCSVSHGSFGMPMGVNSGSSVLPSCPQHQYTSFHCSTVVS